MYIHEDFKSYPGSLLEQLKGAVGCVWALGVTTGQVSARYAEYSVVASLLIVTDALYSEYKTITLDYPLAAAKAFATLSPLFSFVYVSGEGVRPPDSTLFLCLQKLKPSPRQLASLAVSPRSSPEAKAKQNPPSSLWHLRILHYAYTMSGPPLSTTVVLSLKRARSHSLMRC